VPETTRRKAPTRRRAASGAPRLRGAEVQPSLPAAHSPRPRLIWVWGTAYDLFASLEVLHSPEQYGLRKAWAAGMRSRLPTAHRETLEEAQRILPIPMALLYRLPEPRDAATALNVLDDLSPADRLRVLSEHGGEWAA
jgi:hypothetical protein